MLQLIKQEKKNNNKQQNLTEESIDYKQKHAQNFHEKRLEELQNDLGDESDDEGQLNPKEIEKLLGVHLNKQEYMFTESNTRNILLVGKSRSGKTTAINTLKGINNYVTKATIFSETKQPKLTTFALKSTRLLPHYTFNLIDTPGLSEIKKDGEEARTDDEITSIITTLLKMEITKIHIIFLFCSVQATIERTDLEVMKKLQQHFGTEVNMAICITRSEKYDSKKKKNLKKELLEHKEMKEIINSAKNNVFFIGAVDASDGLTKVQLDKEANRVLHDRNLLLNFIFLCSQPQTLLELEFVKKGKTKYLELLQNYKNNMQIFLNEKKLNDNMRKQATKLLQDFSKDDFYKNYLDKECIPFVLSLDQLAKQLKLLIER